jgi:hypothetical protein
LVDTVEPPACHPVTNGPGTEAKVKKLKEGDHPMLPSGDGDNEPVEMPLPSAIDGFRRYRRRFRTIVGHEVMLAPRSARVGGHLCRKADGTITRDGRGTGAFPFGALIGG